MDERSLAEISRRLHAEFGLTVALSEIITVVKRCRRDLDVTSEGGVVELVERLARVRLADRQPPTNDGRVLARTPALV